MDAAPPSPERPLLRSDRRDTLSAAGFAGVPSKNSGEARWSVPRIAAWTLVLAWSALLIGTGLTGMFAKAFL